MMLAYKIFGVNAFAARFFSAIFGVLTVVITYFFSRKFIGDFAAFCSSVMLVMSTHFLFEFRLAVPDPYLIFFISLALFSGFEWLQKNKKKYLFICSAALGLATLAKGPVALVLPALCFLIWIIWKRKWKIFFTLQLIPAFILLFLIAFPWYFLVDKATHGAWTKGFFIDNNLNRFSAPQEGHGGFFLITLIFVLLGLLPFSIFTIEIIKKRKVVFEKELVQFSFLVVVVFIIFFSISSTRLPNYPMPCYPCAAIVLGNYVSLFFTNNFSVKKYPFYILFAIICILSIAGYFAIGAESETSQLKSFSFLLLFPALVLLVLLLLSKDTKAKLLSLIITYTIFNVIGLNFIYPALYGQNPVDKTISLVKQSHNVFAYGLYNPGYNFYLEKNIIQYYNLDSLKTALQKTQGAIIISRADKIDSLKTLSLKVIATHHDIFELPTTIILKQDAKP